MISSLGGIGNGKTKEEYAKFLATPFWQDLTKRKKAMVGKCERCNSQECLQSHHKVYPHNWFDTTLDMLEVLCRKCHKKQHKRVDAVELPMDDADIPRSAFIAPNPEPVALEENPCPFKNWKALSKARGMGLVTRKDFLRWRIELRPDYGMPRPKAERRRIKRRLREPDVRRTRRFKARSGSRPITERLSDPVYAARWGR